MTELAAPTATVTPLTSDQLEAVNLIEELWHRYRRLPTEKELAVAYSSPVEDLFSHPTFRLALEARGVPLPESRTDLPTGLSKQQVAAALKYLDVEDKRSLATKLKEIGVTTGQWYAWMKTKKFQEFVLDNSTRDFEENLHEAQMGLRKAMETGNPAAIKLYYELTKRYNSNEGEIGNLKVVISQIIEAVQRHVTDPETLQLISNDFAAILGGGGNAPIAIQERTPEIRELM